MKQNKTRKPPREGFRPRINPYYSGKNKREIAADVAKTTAKWLAFVALSYLYWLFLLLLFSIVLLNIWVVSIVQILIYSGILCAISSVIYALVLIHRKFYY